MWFREIAAVEDPGRRELQAFVTAVLKFLGFVLEHLDEFVFLWDDDQDLREVATETSRRDASERRVVLRRISVAFPHSVSIAFSFF